MLGLLAGRLAGGQLFADLGDVTESASARVGVEAELNGNLR